MYTLEQIGLEVGLLVESFGTIFATCVENGNFELYWNDANEEEHKAIEVCIKGKYGSKFYMQKDIPRLVEFLENNNFLTELI